MAAVEQLIAALARHGRARRTPRNMEDIVTDRMRDKYEESGKDQRFRKEVKQCQ
jgi:hypothetical protein